MGIIDEARAFRAEIEETARVKGALASELSALREKIDALPVDLDKAKSILDTVKSNRLFANLFK